MSDTIFQRFRLGDILILWALFRQYVWSDAVLPPVTQAIVLASVAVHWHLVPFLFRGHDVHSVCVSVYTLGYHKDFARLVLAHLTHLDDIHMYFNVASFIVKGRVLERRFGSRYFAFILIGLLLSNTIFFGILQHLLAQITNSLDYYYQCCVGLSDITFSLKVITLYIAMFSPPTNVPSSTTAADEDYLVLFGLNKLPRWVVPWLELLLLQKLVPRAAFSPQAAGIISGVIFARYVMPYVDNLQRGRRVRRFSRSESFNGDGRQAALEEVGDEGDPQPFYGVDPFAEDANDDDVDDPQHFSNDGTQQWNFERANITGVNPYDDEVLAETYPFFGNNNTDLIDRLVDQGDAQISHVTDAQEFPNFSAGSSYNYNYPPRRSARVQHRAYTSPPTRRTSRHPSSSRPPPLYVQQNYTYDVLSPPTSHASQHSVQCVYNKNVASSSSSNLPPSRLCCTSSNIFTPSHFNGGDVVRRQRRRPVSDEPVFGISEGLPEALTCCTYFGEATPEADHIMNCCQPTQEDEDDDIRIQIRRQWKIHRERLKSLSAKFNEYGEQYWRSNTANYVVKLPLKLAGEILS